MDRFSPISDAKAKVDFVDLALNEDNRNNACKMRMQKRRRTSLIKHVTRITTIMHDKSYNQI